MSESSSPVAAELAALRAEVAMLEERWRLNHEIDRLAEIAVRDRLPLDHALRLLMPALCEAVGASACWIRTYDESLALHDFLHAMREEGGLPEDLDELHQRIESAERLVTRVDAGTLVAQGIDVAGDAFGVAAVLVDGAPDEAALARIAGLLDVFVEEIDNTLAAIALARKKTLVIDAISAALADPVLDDGLSRALAVLQENVAFEDLLLVFRQEEDVSGRTLHYKIFQNGALAHDSMGRRDPDVDLFLRARALRLMAGDDEEVRERFGIRRYREDVLITGNRSSQVIGRLTVTCRRGEFNTFDRDILHRFADTLRQRIVDFNREWRQLSSTFARDVCERLLRDPDYRTRYLAPRERECAVMFCDIAGFTRICEQVLGRPEAIGRLVDTWSERVVEILWETGGVFDKMVGDCVIGLWGPPFFERSSQELCEAALDAAVRIQKLTRSLSSHEDLPELADQPALEVATGVNLCPLFVGVFGPDEDFTGFSAGMNNTARLQGIAKAGEILCMDRVVEVVGEARRFGPERDARVKNVEHPLRFRALETA